ncbi:SDR family NAD(P)-dependent oxidoreductase [Blastococcus sp. Marseille-P5729]|uniref:SDR family oxidoreductase n=1 Tax=Blastococcus sp. Marseille-P5729 TaxID=2086582 RepID=UPI000D0FEC81|nr:SDR family NAD(P)-dependent oxidoreductase [Blastococcus sp. Marseille-P5729]
MGNVKFDFTNRSVIVTGAARGIGLEVARFFQDAGARTYMCDFDADELKKAADEIGAHGFPVDVSSTEQVEALVGQVVEETGSIDVIVNNAGILRDTVVWKMTDEQWDQVLSVHAGGTFRFTRAAVPHFRKQEYGRIINVTSYTGLHGNTGQANYATAKAGIVGFTKTTAKELARFGVTVNAISPNAKTRMVASIPEDKLGEIAAGIPIGRFAEPEEIAAAIGFLASEEAGYITGTVLPVDGGLAM